MSNVLGTVVPIKEVCRIAHDRGIPVVVDGSQAAVHLTVDVRDLGCDFYVFTGHKVYGPTAIGVLYGRADRLAALRPYQGGGEMIRDVTEGEVTYADPPHRFEAGTPPIVEAIGLGAALAYMESIGRERIAAHEAGLLRYAHERLSAIDGLTIYGTAPEKGAIVSFNIAGAHPARHLDDPRPRGDRRPGGHPLRPAAACPVWRDGDLPRFIRPVQYARRNRPPRRGACQGEEDFSHERAGRPGRPSKRGRPDPSSGQARPALAGREAGERGRDERERPD